MAATPPVISARNLTKRFKDIAAVDDVSLELTLGEIVGLFQRE
jgi:ABC-type multidrug transport system ATPase subunit